MASSWLNLFSPPKKNWASYVTLSWRTNVRASKRILTMYWPGWWRAIEPAQGHVAGSIFAEFFFAKKIEPATRRWASYEALSQLPSIEPATWHWASYVALSQQGSFELARRQWAQWASKVALSFIIYIPMQPQPYNILNLGQNNFFEGDTYLWAGAGMWNLTFDFPQWPVATMVGKIRFTIGLTYPRTVVFSTSKLVYIINVHPSNCIRHQPKSSPTSTWKPT